MAYRDEGGEKLMTVEDATLEELDVRDYVPDNLIVEAHRLDDGATTIFYTYHMVILMCMMEMEVMKRVLKGRATCRDKTTLQGKYNWIPEGWVMEIRTGWEGKEKKLFKFFVHKSSGVLLSSKQDVLAFEEIVRETKIPPLRWPCKENVLLFQEVVKQRKASRGTTGKECDTSSQDNILAQLEFYTWRMSAGWVKEIIFRKCDQGIKKDLYFTDPVSHLVFRTKKSAEQYFWTKKNRKDGSSPTQSVTKKYFFDEHKYMSDERCLDGQYVEPEEEKPETARTGDSQAMTSSQARLVVSNGGQEEYRVKYSRNESI